MGHNNLAHLSFRQVEYRRRKKTKTTFMVAVLSSTVTPPWNWTLKIKDAPNMDTWKNIRDRESGKSRPLSFANRIKSNRISQLELSNHKELISPHKGAINSLQVLFLHHTTLISHISSNNFLICLLIIQIDFTEGRYLLSSASDASVAVYDVQRPSQCDGFISKHTCLFVVDKQHELAHKFAVSSAIWYPIDTGLFITGSYDHHVNVWDTNTTQVLFNLIIIIISWLLYIPHSNLTLHFVVLYYCRLWWISKCLVRCIRLQCLRCRHLTCLLQLELRMFKFVFVILLLGHLLILCLGIEVCRCSHFNFRQTVFCISLLFDKSHYLCYVFLTTSVNLYCQSNCFTINLTKVKIMSKMVQIRNENVPY